MWRVTKDISHCNQFYVNLMYIFVICDPDNVSKVGPKNICSKTHVDLQISCYNYIWIGHILIEGPYPSILRLALKSTPQRKKKRSRSPRTRRTEHDGGTLNPFTSPSAQRTLNQVNLNCI